VLATATITTFRSTTRSTSRMAERGCTGHAPVLGLGSAADKPRLTQRAMHLYVGGRR
jgi:hypothetical protein